MWSLPSAWLSRTLPLGIEAGKRSGARVLALRPHEGVNLDQSAADVIIDNLTDILAAL